MPVLYSGHRVVEEAARRGDLVLDVGDLGLQLLEVLVGLEVRIGLGQREQLAQRAGQHVLGRRLLRRALRGDRGVARLTTASSVPRSCEA